jgi:hypothetical protein
MVAVNPQLSPIGFHYCRRCKTNLSVEDFSCKVSDDGTKSVLIGTCKQCEIEKAKQQILRPLPDSKYKEAYKRQGGKCAICHKTPSPNQHLNVDHCHETGLFRGLLCTACNWAVGRLGDSPEAFLRAVGYLLDGGTCADMQFDMSISKQDLWAGEDIKRLSVLRKKPSVPQT